MKKILLTAALAAGLAASAGAADGFTKSVVFTTSGYRGASTLANFPVLVKLSDAIQGFDYADFGAGTNLLFKDADGFAIPHEVDTWNTNGTSLVWVKVPSVTAATTFTMYYDGASDAGNDPAAVWTGAGYVGVWHMDEPDGSVADATGHGLDATPMSNATVSVRYAGDAPVGHARQTGTSAAKGYLSVPSYDSFAVGGTFTVSGWVRLTENVANSPRLFSRKEGYKDANGWEIEMATASPANFNVRGANQDKNALGGSFNPSLRDRWTHVAFVYDESSCAVYSNGYALVSGTITAATDNGLPLSIGCDSDGSEPYIRGAFDECRLLDAVASADWIAAEYETVERDSFVTASEVVSAAPVLGTVTVTPAASSAAISGTILSPGLGNATACDVYLAVGTSPDALGPSKKIASFATTTFSYRIPDLWARTTYFYELSVTNNATPVRVGSSQTGSFTTPANFDFHKKVSFTVNSTNENDLAVPALVRLSKGSPAGFDPRHCAEGGRDLFFVDANGDEIPCEIDTWDPAGESLVWVKLPSVRRGTAFTMYYRGTPSSGGTASDVWSDYAGVWHLNGLVADDPATWQSQGLYPNSTAAAGIDAHLSTNSVPGETGRFGKAFRVNDSTGPSAGNYHEGGAWVVDAGADSPLDANGVFTISGWFKHANWNFNWDKMFFKRNDINNETDPTGAFAVRISAGDGTTKVEAHGSGDNRVRLDNEADRKASMVDNWVYLTVVYNGGTISIYENGEWCKKGTYLAPAVDNDQPLVFGNNVAVAGGETGEQAWNGWIDEVRFLKGSKSAEWIAAEYAAMADPDFLTAGAAENIVKPTVIVVR